MKFRLALVILTSIISAISMTAEAVAQISSAEIAFFERSDQEVLSRPLDVVKERRYEQMRPRAEVPVNPNLLDNYIGYYELLPGSIFQFTRNGDHLFFQSVQREGQPVEILAENDHRFFIKYGATQFTFVTPGPGPAAEMIFHAGGYDRHAPRISEARALAYAESLEQRITNKIAVRGSDVALRLVIAAEQQGKPLYDEMGPLVARATYEQLLYVTEKLAALGPLQSLVFKGVGPAGADIYDVNFANGSAEWRIFLAPDGKIRGLSHRFWP
jgi:hypothetical protein